MSDELAFPLVETCRVAATGLVEILSAEPEAVHAMRELGLQSRISATFLQVCGTWYNRGSLRDWIRMKGARASCDEVVG